MRRTCQARSYGRCVTDDVARIERKVNYIGGNTTATHSIVIARCGKCDAIRFDDLPTVTPTHNPHRKRMLLSPHVRHVHTSCQLDVVSTCTTRSQNTSKDISEESALQRTPRDIARGYPCVSNTSQGVSRSSALLVNLHTQTFYVSVSVFPALCPCVSNASHGVSRTRKFFGERTGTHFERRPIRRAQSHWHT